PFRDVDLGHRSEVQERPAVGRGEGLAGRDACRINTRGNALALEERRHRASIGARVYSASGLKSSLCGPVAQLGERVNRTHEARGSNPLGSTKVPTIRTRSTNRTTWQFGRPRLPPCHRQLPTPSPSWRRSRSRPDTRSISSAGRTT